MGRRFREVYHIESCLNGQRLQQDKIRQKLSERPMSRPLKTRRPKAFERKAASHLHYLCIPRPCPCHDSPVKHVLVLFLPTTGMGTPQPAASNANNAKKLFFLITISTLHSESVMLASSISIQSSRPCRPRYRSDDRYAKFDSGKRKLLVLTNRGTIWRSSLWRSQRTLVKR